MESQDDFGTGLVPSPSFWGLCLQIAYWSLFRPFTLLRYVDVVSPDRELGVEISYWQRIGEIVSTQRVRRLLLATLFSSVLWTATIVGGVGVFTRIFGQNFDWELCWPALASSLLGIWLVSFLIGVTMGVAYGAISCVNLSVPLCVLFGIGAGVGFAPIVQLDSAISIGAGTGLAVGAALGPLALLIVAQSDEEAFGLKLGIGVGILLGVSTALFLGLSLVLSPEHSLALGASVWLGWSVGYTRMWAYLPERVWQTTVYTLWRLNIWTVSRAYKYSPISWDELAWLGFPFAEEMLYALLFDQENVNLSRLISIYDIPGQREAMRKAVARFVVSSLAECESIEQIADIEKQVAWSVEDIAVLGQDIATITHELFSVSCDVNIALRSENLILRVRGLERVSGRLMGVKGMAATHGFAVSQRWGPVIGRWYSLVNKELNKYPEVYGIPNPYLAGDPIYPRRAALFRGRSDLIEAVSRCLSERSRLTMMLHGPRRMGKTSFLLQLPRLLPRHTIPVFVDLQHARATDSNAEFLLVIARTVVNDARNHSHIALPAPEQTAFERKPFVAFADWLEGAALPALDRAGRRLTLLLSFDEFEKLGQAIEVGRVDERVLDELRYTMQHREVIRLLFAGVQTFDELGPHWASYFINVRPLRITYLRPEEAVGLIRNPDPESDFNLEYTDEAVMGILNATRCHPYLVQLVCEAVVNLANERGTLVATPDLVQDAQTGTLAMGEPYFRNIWDESTGTDADTIAAGQSILRHAAVSSGPVAPATATPAAIRALEHLLHHDVLERTDDGVQFQVPLVRRWVRECAPVGYVERL